MSERAIERKHHVGRENLKTLARPGRLPLTAVDPVLERSGLLARAGDRYRSYSLGMKRRGLVHSLVNAAHII